MIGAGSDASPLLYMYFTGIAAVCVLERSQSRSLPVLYSHNPFGMYRTGFTFLSVEL